MRFYCCRKCTSFVGTECMGVVVVYLKPAKPIKDVWFKHMEAICTCRKVFLSYYKYNYLESAKLEIF